MRFQNAQVFAQPPCHRACRRIAGPMAVLWLPLAGAIAPRHPYPPPMLRHACGSDAVHWRCSIILAHCCMRDRAACSILQHTVAHSSRMFALVHILYDIQIHCVVSPFDPVELNGRTYTSSQCNNMVRTRKCNWIEWVDIGCKYVIVSKVIFLLHAHEYFLN